MYNTGLCVLVSWWLLIACGSGVNHEAEKTPREQAKEQSSCLSALVVMNTVRVV